MVNHDSKSDLPQCVSLFLKSLFNGSKVGNEKLLFSAVHCIAVPGEGRGPVVTRMQTYASKAN